MRTGVAKDKAKDKNVIHARLKKAGCRFELSLFRDKVPSKQDISAKGWNPNWLEILSAQVVFANAAKGEVADKKDLDKAFPEMETSDIFRQILEKGEILATIEDKNEQSSEILQLITKVATVVAKTSHVLPSREDLAGPKKPKLERHTAVEIEREMKAMKFKLNPALSVEEMAVDVIAAFRMQDVLPIFRDVRYCEVKATKDDSGLTADQIKKELSKAVRPYDYKIVASDAEKVSVVLDYNNAEPRALGMQLSLTWVAPPRDEFYIPTKDDGSDDITTLTSGAVAVQEKKGGAAPVAKKAADAKPAQKPAGKGKKAQSDSDEDEGGDLEAQLKALKAEDSDEDGKKGKKGKGKPQPKSQPKPSAKAAAAPQAKKGRRNEFDSDEEN